MTTLTIPHAFTPGTPILSAQTNANNSAIVSWSTQISNDNVKTGAAIDPAKLDLTQPFPVNRATTLTAFSAGITGEANPRWLVNADGQMKFGPGAGTPVDLQLARSSSTVIGMTVVGDANASLALTTTGLQLGAGGASALDMMIRRTSSAILRVTDAANSAMKSLDALSFNVYSSVGAANPIISVSAGNDRINFGPGGASAADVFLRRRNSTTLEIGAGTVMQNLSIGSVSSFLLGTDANAAAVLDTSGLHFGSGAASALDLLISRVDANTIRLTNDGGSANKDLRLNAVSAFTHGDANPKAVLNTTGILLGAGGATATDILVKRESAGVVAIRNAADSAYEDLKVDNLTVAGTITGGGAGTVTSFSASPAGIFDVANPNTTPALSLDNQSANTVLAGPTSGGAATPAFRALVLADFGIFTSTDQTITAGGTLTLAHSLGRIPLLAWVILVCQTAELGYSIGDLLMVFPPVGSSVANTGVSVVVDATNLVIRYGSVAASFTVPNKTTGARADLTNANWRARFHAF